MITMVEEVRQKEGQWVRIMKDQKCEETVKRLLDLLEGLQWSSELEGEGCVMCPDCGGVSWRGHREGCGIAKELELVGRKVEWAL